MKREILIGLLRVAGYHDDAATYTRLLIENRISYGKAKAAYAEGVRQREAGVPCDCRTCKVTRARAGANARQSAMCANFGRPPAPRPGFVQQITGESSLEAQLHARATERLVADPAIVDTEADRAERKATTVYLRGDLLCR